MAVPQIATFEDILFEMQQYIDDDGYSYPRKLDLLPPQGAPIYKIDLDSRIVESPDILSVQYDHNAEVLYFKCARYFEHIDLASMICIVEYVNANGEAGLYWVPFIDTSHYDTEVDDEGNEFDVPMIYIPWSIQGLATAYSGKIKFAIRFYKLSADGKHYMFNLSTRPKTGEVLHGMDLTDDDPLYIFKLNPEEQVVIQIYNDLAISVENAITYWEDV